jgi:hypothetical protein
MAVGMSMLLVFAFITVDGYLPGVRFRDFLYILLYGRIAYLFAAIKLKANNEVEVNRVRKCGKGCGLCEKKRQKKNRSS